jgi:predicted nucleic acid-binding protein
LIVLDSSAVIDWLLQTTAGLRIWSRIRRESVHAPHLLDLEVADVLRRLVRGGTLPAWNAGEALKILRDFQIVRYPHVTFLPRIWQYRHTLSAYDAAYVVLAETLDATLITRDARLAAAHGHGATIELF